MERELKLLCGGKPVELNRFSESVVIGTVLGLVSALRDVDTRREITVIIGPAKEEPT